MSDGAWEWELVKAVRGLVRVHQALLAAQLLDPTRLRVEGDEIERAVARAVELCRMDGPER